MVGYCSATGTRTTREKILEYGWNVLWTASGHNWDSLPIIPGYAIDNGAWSSYLSGREWSESDFLRCLNFSREFSKGTGHSPLWCVLPDIVAGGLRSLDFSLRWINTVKDYSRIMLIAVQDGMRPEDVERYLGPEIGIFLGGSTEWKLKNMMEFGELAKSKDAYYHVARCNSQKRIHHAAAAGADSFDGTSVCRFPCTIKNLDRAIQQMTLPIF